VYLYSVMPAMSMRIVRVISLALCGCTLMAVTAAGQRSEPKHVDSSLVQTRPIPPFFLVRGWETTVAQAEHTSAQDPLSYAVERLCKMHQTQFDPQSIVRENRSPFAWPDVFEHDVVNPTRQRIEARALLDANGLEYGELIPLDLSVRHMADSLASSIANDQPVMINAPSVPVVYGYDRREPDHWWWCDVAGIPEIELESERTSRFTLWTDDPAAGVAWVVTGVED
jgi:hypothetical protein